MISKYNGTCRYCKQPTKANIDHYELETKTGFHEKCQNDAEALSAEDNIALAEHLGFVDYGDIESVKWSEKRYEPTALPILSHAAGGRPTEPVRGDGDSRGEQAALFCLPDYQ